MGALKTEKEWEECITAKSIHNIVTDLPIHCSPKAFSHHKTEGLRDLIHMGFEWEVGFTSGMRYDVKDGGPCYKLTKEALGTPLRQTVNFRYGGAPLEMVSIPATMKYLRELMVKEFFDKKFNKDMCEDEGCGIHIHIAKKAFTENTLRKFITFVCVEENRPFMEAIGGRPISEDEEECTWCQPNDCRPKYTKSSRLIGKPVLMGSDITFNEDLQQKNAGYYGKDAAINTHTDYPTVEFRIFNSVISEQKFIKNLEFTDALVRYVRTAAYNKLNPQDFTRYVLENKETYPYLNKEKVIQDIAVTLKPKAVRVIKVKKKGVKEYVQNILPKARAKKAVKKSKVA